MKKLIGAFIFGLLGVGMLWAAMVKVAWLDESRLAMGAGAAAAWLVAGLLGMQWAADELLPSWDAHQLEAAQRKAVTPDSELVRRMAELQPHQAEALMRLQAALVITPGVAGAVLEYDLDGRRAPAEFVREFMNESNGEHLKAIRSWSDGTKGREWAQAITDFFVTRGLARPGVGNQPARWIYGCEVAGRWLAILDEEPENG